MPRGGGAGARGQNLIFLHTLFFFKLFCMVGPCGGILPQWLRAPCNGVSKTDIVVGKVQCVCVCVCVCVCARSTQYADGRTLGIYPSG